MLAVMQLSGGALAQGFMKSLMVVGGHVGGDAGLGLGYSLIGLDGLEVGFGGEASVKDGLSWGLSIDALVPDDHLGCRQGVGRIAILDGAIGDEAGGAVCQPPETPCSNCSTYWWLCLPYDKARLCYLRRGGPPRRCGSSPRPSTSLESSYVSP